MATSTKQINLVYFRPAQRDSYTIFEEHEATLNLPTIQSRKTNLVSADGVPCFQIPSLSATPSLNIPEIVSESLEIHDKDGSELFDNTSVQVRVKN